MTMKRIHLVLAALFFVAAASSMFAQNAKYKPSAAAIAADPSASDWEVKTGYTKAAGRCLVFAAKRDGLELIGVVLNCPDWFDEAAALLDRGFENWQMVTILNAGETVREIPVIGGVRDAVRAVAQRDVSAPVPDTTWPDLLIDLPSSLPAGVEKGQVIGTASLTDQGRTLVTVPLVAADAVPERSFRYGFGRVLSVWPLAAGE